MILGLTLVISMGMHYKHFQNQKGERSVPAFGIVLRFDDVLLVSGLESIIKGHGNLTRFIMSTGLMNGDAPTD